MDNPFAYQDSYKDANSAILFGAIVARKQLHGVEIDGYRYKFNDLKANFEQFVRCGVQFEIAESAEGHHVCYHEVSFDDIPDDPLEIKRLKFWHPEDLQ